jgi:hypothetical protein
LKRRDEISDSIVSIRKFGRVRYLTIILSEPKGVGRDGKECTAVPKGMGREGEGEASKVRMLVSN